MFKQFLLILSVVSSPLFAQNSGSKVVYVNKKTGVPGLIRFDAGTSNKPSAENITGWFRNNLNANSAFRLKFTTSTQSMDGSTHLRYQQYFGRFPVEAGQVVMHVKQNSTYALNGKFFPHLDTDSSVYLSPSNAISKALALHTNAIYMWEVPAEENLLKTVSKNPKATYYPNPELMYVSTHESCRNSDFRLAYKLDVYTYAPHNREWIYVDAQTGEILERENRICNMDRVGIAHTKYAGLREITCDSITADTFILRDNTRGNGIYTIDVRIIGTDSSRDFVDADNIWDNKNIYKDEVATDVHWGSAFTYDYYKTYHNRLSYDGEDAMIFSKVHVGNKYNNAFWNGSSANYGDGDGSNLSPLTSIDVVAHELTHGVTGNSSGLKYRYESGALNESFSDIFGKTAEYLSDSAGFSWRIAKKIALKGTNYFRDMSFPPNKSHPKYYGGKHWYTGSADNGGVHLNSGVQNFWFYLLCNGGTGIREADSLPYTVKPIGFTKAGQVAYMNLTAYLSNESEYYDACYLSLDAASVLFGENSEEYNQVKKAWFAVGLLNQQELGITTQNTAAAWQVYPNPGNNALQVYNPGYMDEASVEMYDISGKQLLKATVKPNEPIDVSSLANGMYVVRINNGTVLKWVKQ